MQLRKIAEHSITGGITGFVIALVAVLLRFRQHIKNGIYVETKYIQRNHHLVELIRQIRPLCQTGKFSVSPKFKEFVEKVDRLTGSALQHRAPGVDQTDLLNVVKSAAVNGSITPRMELDISSTLQQLTQACVV